MLRYLIFPFLMCLSTVSLAQRERQRIDLIRPRDLPVPKAPEYEAFMSSGNCGFSIYLSLVNKNASITIGYSHTGGIGNRSLLKGTYTTKADTVILRDGLSGLTMLFKRDSLVMFPLQTFACMRGAVCRKAHVYSDNWDPTQYVLGSSCPGQTKAPLLSKLAPGHYSSTKNKNWFWICFGAKEFSLLFHNTMLLEGRYSNTDGVIKLYDKFLEHAITLYNTEAGLIADTDFPWGEFCKFDLLRN